jgi:toxin ParE1/3/4
MTKELVFSDPAIGDIDEIYDYTEDNWGAAKAEDYVVELRACCVALADQTRHGRPLRSKKQGYLALTFRSHFIIYTESRDELVIARILHRRMNIDGHL